MDDDEPCNAFSHDLCTPPLCAEDWVRLVKEVEGPRKYSPEKAAFLEECRKFHEQVIKNGGRFTIKDDK